MRKNTSISALFVAIILIIFCFSFSAFAEGVTTYGGAETSSNSEIENSSAAENNYITFATVGTKSNTLATMTFYSGVACIVLGLTGLIVLSVMFFRNRRYIKNHRERIFEEIEQAETRKQTEYIPQDRRYSAENVERPAENFAATAPLVPIDVSMYTEEFLVYDNSYSPAPPNPAPVRQPVMSGASISKEAAVRPEAPYRPAPTIAQSQNLANDMYNTDELLLEILGKMDD